MLQSHRKQKLVFEIYYHQTTCLLFLLGHAPRSLIFQNGPTQNQLKLAKEIQNKTTFGHIGFCQQQSNFKWHLLITFSTLIHPLSLGKQLEQITLTSIFECVKCISSKVLNSHRKKGVIGKTFQIFQVEKQSQRMIKWLASVMKVDSKQSREIGWLLSFLSFWDYHFIQSIQLKGKWSVNTADLDSCVPLLRRANNSWNHLTNLVNSYFTHYSGTDHDMFWYVANNLYFLRVAFLKRKKWLIKTSRLLYFLLVIWGAHYCSFYSWKDSTNKIMDNLKSQINLKLYFRC